MPSAFHRVMRQPFHRLYKELRRIDRSIDTADAEQLSACLGRLEKPGGRVTSLRVPVTYASMICGLEAHISSVRNRGQNAMG
jgi:hypothetical protein